MTKKARCFVAMAFGQSDTDKLYEKAIAPVLRELDVIAVIINRKEDNTDLNIQIFRDIEAADFVIADLTYARPSVYFEAGYAQRAVEVIYTARKDHFRNKDDSLRVHFDLSVKNIIDWHDQKFTIFRDRLRKRISNTALKEFRRREAAVKKNRDAEKSWKKLPIYEQIIRLRKYACLSARKSGVDRWRIVPVGYDPRPYSRNRKRKALQLKFLRSPNLYLKHEVIPIGSMTHGDSTYIFQFHVERKVLKDTVTLIGHLGRGRYALPQVDDGWLEGAKNSVRFCYIVMALNSVSTEKIRDMHREAKLDIDLHRLDWTETIQDRTAKCSLWVIANYKTEQDFKSKIDEIIATTLSNPK